MKRRGGICRRLGHDGEGWKGRERKKEGKAEKVERKKKCGRERGRTTRERNFPRVKQSKIPPQKTRKDTLPARREEREGTFALPGTPVSGRRCRVDGEQGTAAASKQASVETIQI